MSKDPCFVSPLYFSQKSEDLFSLSSKFFFFNIFFFQIPDPFADRESVWPARVWRGRGEGEGGGVQQPHLAGQWSVVSGVWGRGRGPEPAVQGLITTNLEDLKLSNDSKQLCKMEKTLPGRKYYLNQIIRQERFWPFSNLVSTPAPSVRCLDVSGVKL